MTNTDYIIKQIPILEVAQRLGIQIINKQAFCFNGHDRKTPSLIFYSKTNSFHCFGCSAGSTNIDLVMQAEGLDFEEAVKWIEIEFGLKPGKYAQPKPLKKNFKPFKGVSEPRTSRHTHIYDILLIEYGLTSQGEEYLASRGLSQKTADHFGIISIDDPSQFELTLLNYHNRTELKQAGFYNDNDKFLFFRPGILIPFIQNDSVAYWLMRTYQGEPKYLNLANQQKPIWNIESINNYPYKSQVAIFEDIFDALSSYELLPNLPALAIVGEGDPGKLANLFINYELLFGQANEPQGSELLGKVLEEFKKRGGLVKPYPIPYEGYKDLNEYLTKGLQW